MYRIDICDRALLKGSQQYKESRFKLKIDKSPSFEQFQFSFFLVNKFFFFTLIEKCTNFELNLRVYNSLQKSMKT